MQSSELSSDSELPAPPKKVVWFREVEGDLFDSKDSLAHCVSKDLRMGMGIAKEFKARFGDDIERKNVGECAMLRSGRERRIFYLVTKERYYQKPTYETLSAALQSLRQLCVDNNITKLSMPQIGCGLDRLRWDKVRSMIRDTFKDKVAVTIYIKRSQ